MIINFQIHWYVIRKKNRIFKFDNVLIINKSLNDLENNLKSVTYSVLFFSLLHSNHSIISMSNNDDKINPKTLDVDYLLSRYE